MAHLKRYLKGTDKKVDTVVERTKKKTPKKREPRPKEDNESDKNKLVLTAAQLKKLLFSKNSFNFILIIIYHRSYKLSYFITN